MPKPALSVSVSVANSLSEKGRPRGRSPGTDGQPLAASSALLEMPEKSRVKQPASGDHCRTLFHFIDDGFCVIEKVLDGAGKALDFRYLEANPAFLLQSGVSETSAVVGKTIRQLFPAITEDWYRTYDEVLQTGEAIRFERELVSRERWLELYAFPVGAGDRHQLGVICKDITSRVLADEKRLETEAINRSIIASSPDWINILDLNGKLLSILSGQHLLGLSDVSALLGKPWLALWHSDYKQAAHVALNAALTGSTGNFIGSFIAPSGSRKNWHVALSPILDMNGKPSRLLAVSREVTRHQQAEMNLAFLAAVSQELVNWNTVSEMMSGIGEKIGLHLQLSRCAFVEVDETAQQAVVNYDWHREDVSSLVGAYRLADFVGDAYLQAARSGNAIVVNDVANCTYTHPAQCATLKIASFVSLPLIRDGQWRFTLSLYKAEVYEWRDDEITLARELTMRIWARMERLRVESALRESEQRYRTLFESMDDGFCIIEKLEHRNASLDFRYIEANLAFEKQFGLSDVVGKTHRQVVPDESDDWLITYDCVLRTGEPIRFERGALSLGRVFELYVHRVPDEGQRRLAVLFKDVTERKRAEAALRQSEERFRALVTASSDVVFRMSPDGREMEQLHGPNLFVNTTGPNTNWLQEHIAPADQVRVLAVIDEAIRTKSLFELEHQVRLVDGSLGWSFSHAIPIVDANGEIVEWFGTASDVTRHKRAEQALRESEDRYRHLFNSMDEGYCIIEMIFDQHSKPVDYQYLEVNPAFEAMSGMQGVLGKRIREMVPDLEDYWFETYGKVALTGQAVRVVNEVKPLQRWFDVYAFRFGGAESRKVAVLFTNITERKKAEETMRESEARFRALFDWGPIAMYSCDSDGVIQEYNRSAVKIWETKPEPGNTDEQFRGLFKIYRPDGTYIPYEQTAMTQVLKGKTPSVHDIEVVLERPDASRITLIVNVVPLKDELGSVTGAITCFYDISERSRLERKTLEQAEALADLDRRKDEFLAMLSHELRNPLAPILNAVRLLRMQKNEDPLQLQARTVIERQVGQLNRLIDELLEISRITTGRVQLRQEQITMSGIVERAVETTQPLLTQRRHALRLSLPPTPIWLYADAARLEQVLVNLLTNAAKYTDEGGHIELDVQLQESSAVLTVKDNGIGIAPELLPHIFELFTQAERSLDRSQGGLGIGLCLVQRLVELHGGSVAVKSAVGQGSEFVVRLPMVVAQLPSPPTLTPPAIPSSPNEQFRRVLVVDDNVDAAQSLGDLLSLSGHEVRLAHNGLDALEQALSWCPDVVLLDIGLPGLNGLEVARRIRQQAARQAMVLVALTGYGRAEDRKRSQDAGFDYHLVKPADFEELEKILQGTAVTAS